MMAVDWANQNSSGGAGIFDSSDNYVSHQMEMEPGGEQEKVQLPAGEQEKVRVTFSVLAY